MESENFVSAIRKDLTEEVTHTQVRTADKEAVMPRSGRRVPGRRKDKHIRLLMSKLQLQKGGQHGWSLSEGRGFQCGRYRASWNRLAKWCCPGRLDVPAQFKTFIFHDPFDFGEKPGVTWCQIWWVRTHSNVFTLQHFHRMASAAAFAIVLITFCKDTQRGGVPNASEK